MQAVILAGGLGTRLRSSVPDLPKPMAPIAGKPFLEALLMTLKAEGITDILLLTGYKSEVIKAHFGTGESLGLSIDYSDEPAPLGTGGALLHAWDKVDNEFLLINGDTFFDFQYDLLVDFAQERDLSAVMALRLSEDISRYGVVDYDDTYRINAFVEKGTLPAHQVDGFINGGIYYFRKSILNTFYTRWQNTPLSIEQDVFPQLIAQEKLFGLPVGGKFVDIGIPESYEYAQTAIPECLAQKRKPVLFLDRDGVIIRDTNYVFGTDVEFLPDGFEHVENANRLRHWVLVITNQAGVAKGHFAESDIDITHRHIDATYRAKGLKIDDFFYCPYHPEGTVADYRKLSLCRKPFPGMLLKAAESYRIDFRNALMVGDNPQVDRIRLPYLKSTIVPNQKVLA